MKFAKKLEAEAVPEWRPKYLQYKQLKKLIKRILEGRSVKSSTDVEMGIQCNMTMEEERLFVDSLEMELAKIEEFYKAREKEAVERKFKIMAQLDILPQKNDIPFPSKDKLDRVSTTPIKSATSSYDEEEMSLVPKKSPASPIERLKISSLRRSSYTQLARMRIKKALLEFYRSLELLGNFKSLNVMAVSKILKKFDKNVADRGSKLAEPYGQQLHKNYTFFSSKMVDHLMDDVENIFRWVFTGGDRNKALRKLRIKDLKSRTFHDDALVSGMFLTGCITLIWRLFWLAAFNSSPIHVKTLGIVYFGFGLPFLMAWLFAMNAKTWESYYINYRFIFEYNQRTNLHVYQYIALIGFLSTLYLSLAALSMEGWLDWIVRPMLQPWLVIFVIVSVILWPGNQLYRQTRLWFARVFMRIVTVPFYPCRFKDFFIADQLMSLTCTFEVLGRLIYYSGSKQEDIKTFERPAVWYIFILAMLPAIWRSLQCLRRYRDSRMAFPHLANLAKYLCSLSVPLFDCLFTMGSVNSFWYALVAARIISSMFSLGWDVVMDFGLWQRSAVNDRLRSAILFKPIIYWILIVSDTLARFLWIIALLKPKFIHPIVLLLFLWTVEVLRRFQWNFFRLEYEHVNNCNILRAVTDVPLPFTATDLFYQDMVETIQVRRQTLQYPITVDGLPPSDMASGDEDGTITAASSINESDGDRGDDDDSYDGNNNTSHNDDDNDPIMMYQKQSTSTVMAMVEKPVSTNNQ